ncbi:MAG: ABC transporter permease, partial [Burkholderiales bacterium]|nr:ABC transporter permease [Burkholderiales bacterium]
MIKKTFELIGEYILLMKRVFTRPEKWKIFWKQCVMETEKLGMTSISLIGVISIAIGAVLVIQTAYNIENPFIPKMYVGYMVRESLILEFSCTMVALILAG